MFIATQGWERLIGASSFILIFSHSSHQDSFSIYLIRFLDINLIALGKIPSCFVNWIQCCDSNISLSEKGAGSFHFYHTLVASEWDKVLIHFKTIELSVIPGNWKWFMALGFSTSLLAYFLDGPQRHTNTIIVTDRLGFCSLWVCLFLTKWLYKPTHFYINIMKHMGFF